MSALPGGAAAATPLRAADVAPTRERLLAAARTVVEDHGYAGASVAAIAVGAGVAAGTLYRHFGSKAELFVEVFRDVCGREVGAMRAAVEAVEGTDRPDPVERVLAPLDVFARRALQNRTLAWALLAEPVDALVDEVRLEYRRTYRDLLAGLLVEAIDAGALPPQDAELTAAALVGAVGEALVGPVSPRAVPAPEPDDALLDGLRAVCRRATGATVQAGDRVPRVDGGR
ncbi:TetR/AcrR family transcriptional regulator [Patulibacter sp.]|uniref:TetR/AcrR family transcriptional regulator n=1 Tax=Patulibacter sp. TaxID=1912859 RepID=UPI002717804A|nr:TetR/AcrR family transcriptional regulator [Patulibacter sp.]MDO9410399.1 TetR/AcrR family transcriptional regulator [Patulibacter sp.]